MSLSVETAASFAPEPNLAPEAETDRYGAVAIGLHWTIAGLILLNLALGWTFRQYTPPIRRLVMSTHESIGLTVLILTVVRFGWRLAHRPPPFASHLSRLERTAATAVHLGFYALLLVLPVAGWLTASAFPKPKPLALWGLPVPFAPLPALTPEGRHALLNGSATLHARLAWLFVALLTLHLAGALKHQFLDRDRALSRMAPWLAPAKR